MTTTEAISAAQWIADFSVNGPPVTDYDECGNLIVNREAAIWWTGPWAIHYFRDAGINYGIAPMGSPFVGVRNLMLTTNAVERGDEQAAIEVMLYFGSPEIQKRLAMANKTIPANTVALNDPEVQAIYEIAQFGKSLNLGTPMGNHIYAPCQWGPVADAVMAIWDGSQTPQEAMNTAQLLMEACVEGQDPSVITIWHQWDVKFLPEYQDIVAQYNLAHPDMTIKLVKQYDMAGALSGSIPYGAGPDIIAWANDQIGGLASAGYLAPLNAWVDQSYLSANFEPAAVKGMIWDDLVWGIPDTQEGIALVYNRDLITDTAIPAPDDFAGMFTDAVQFQLDNPGKYYLCNQGLGGYDAYHAAPIYFEHGLSEYGGFVDEEGTVYMTTTQAISAAQWIADFSINGPITTTYDTCRNLMINGDAAIWWTGPWAMLDLQNAGVNYGIAPMGSPFVGSKNYMLTTNAVDREKTEAAIDLMKYLGSFEVQKQLTMANQTIPANTAALNDPDVQAIKEVAGFGASLHLGTPMANHIYSDCQWGPVGEATWAIWNGAQTPLDAMNTAQLAIEACVAGMGP
jgi:arabinogalactan oligomer/maltooligosaccharide transport system substrate-binding protein